jgi:hypothetical protein
MRSVALFVVITIPGAQHHLESERHSRRSMIVVSNGSSNVFDDLTYACLSCCCACDCSGYDDMPLQPGTRCAENARLERRLRRFDFGEQRLTATLKRPSAGVLPRESNMLV